VPGRHHAALELLRAAVLSVVPAAEEGIRRGVSASRYRGRPLVGLGSARHHVSLYVMEGATLRAHRSRLAGYDTSNTVVRFDPSRPVPVDLVSTLVLARARRDRVGSEAA
jgi:uncharacterized protein YdhG (YjbR/CyaY superfamily)